MYSVSPPIKEAMKAMPIRIDASFIWDVTLDIFSMWFYFNLIIICIILYNNLTLSWQASVEWQI